MRRRSHSTRRRGTFARSLEHREGFPVGSALAQRRGCSDRTIRVVGRWAERKESTSDVDVDALGQKLVRKRDEMRPWR